MNAMDDRFEALETKAAYQDQTLSELSGQVWDIARRLDRLETLVADLRRKQGEAEGSGSNPSADVKPPHY